MTDSATDLALPENATTGAVALADAPDTTGAAALADTPDATGTAADVDPELRGRALDGILQLLPRVLKRDLPEIGENACLFDEVGLTSAGTLELILELEDHLDVQIDVEGIDQDDLRSVGTLAGFVAGHVIAED
ncbi:acyl carrier protein [Kitasatospora cineracea]|uniref:Acyl carrier protein n=1 Tax=Kitasatospora cineracea TaxID=88074 RepID=A0A8G1UAV0_9ACTN|nr:acyl carrier protein [Kitasatospora cineracea]ROR37370.1 acyl carrier protein [Kitasatospora cineracea]